MNLFSFTFILYYHNFKLELFITQIFFRVSWILFWWEPLLFYSLCPHHLSPCPFWLCCREVIILLTCFFAGRVTSVSVPFSEICSWATQRLGLKMELPIKNCVLGVHTMCMDLNWNQLLSHNSFIHFFMPKCRKRSLGATNLFS